jgi:hypothetical protein
MRILIRLAMGDNYYDECQGALSSVTTDPNPGSASNGIWEAALVRSFLLDEQISLSGSTVLSFYNLKPYNITLFHIFALIWSLRIIMHRQKS